MSYPRDLDDYTEAELYAELERRRVARHQGRCDYCGSPYMAPVCRYPERHSLHGRTADNGWEPKP